MREPAHIKINCLVHTSYMYVYYVAMYYSSMYDVCMYLGSTSSYSLLVD